MNISNNTFNVQSNLNFGNLSTNANKPKSNDPFDDLL